MGSVGMAHSGCTAVKVQMASVRWRLCWAVRKDSRAWQHGEGDDQATLCALLLFAVRYVSLVTLCGLSGQQFWTYDILVCAFNPLEALSVLLKLAPKVF